MQTDTTNHTPENIKHVLKCLVEDGGVGQRTIANALGARSGDVGRWLKGRVPKAYLTKIRDHVITDSGKIAFSDISRLTLAEFADRYRGIRWSERSLEDSGDVALFLRAFAKARGRVAQRTLANHRGSHWVIVDDATRWADERTKWYVLLLTIDGDRSAVRFRLDFKSSKSWEAYVGEVFELDDSYYFIGEDERDTSELVFMIIEQKMQPEPPQKRLWSGLMLAIRDRKPRIMNLRVSFDRERILDINKDDDKKFVASMVRFRTRHADLPGALRDRVQDD